MKIALWTTVAAVGLGLAACGNGDNTGSMSSTSSTPPPPPVAEVPTDFVGFVNQQIVSEPAFGVAPDVTSSITMDFALGNASVFGSYTGGDVLPMGTFQASVACTQAGPAKCNPQVSADLNSTLN
jgi:hypothetical protein